MLVDSFSQYINERCLTFKYGGDDKNEKAEQLAKVLKENNIDFICYNTDSTYYHCQFVVRRCGKKWNDLMRLINSIKAAKYDYVKTDFYIKDMEQEHKGILGNMQEVIHCN